MHVKLRSFPFIGLTVHGTSTYRKPGLYHYQLQNLPRIASKFDDLRYDLGDPASWGTRYDIAMAPQSTDDVPVLRLTPKKPGGQVSYLDIETDAQHARMLKATWTRHDGGTIVLTQTYAPLGSADVVTQQHATIDIPHLRAEVTATYTQRHARHARRSPASANAKQRLALVRTKPSAWANFRIGLIGAGEMGSAVGGRLAARGADVRTTLAGRSAASAERVRRAGITTVDDLAAVARSCPIVLSIVPPDRAVARRRRFRCGV